jgi:hypothetical protein
VALHLPTNELVGVHWIRSIEGIPTNQVNTDLPADNTTWEVSGFVQVTLAGGSPDVYTPQNQPVFQVDCWAAKPNSEKPPWGKANNLAEIIKAACYDKRYWGFLALPATHQNARVLGSVATTEPRRVQGDEARFACYTFDLQLFWVRNLT